MVKISSTMLNENGGHPCLLPHLKGKIFRFLLLSMMLSVDLLYMSCITLRHVPSILTLLSVYHKWMLNYVRSFFSMEMIIWFLSLILLVWKYITFIGFCMLNYPCISEINPTFSWYIILLMYCWVWLHNILLKNFTCVIIRDIDL